MPLLSTDADASAISRPPGRGVVRRFTLVSLVLTVAATTVVSWAMGRVVDGYLLWRAASDVSVQFNRAVLPLVPEEGLVALLDPRASPALAGEAHSRLLELPSERVALLAPDGGLVYQSRPSLAPASSAQLRRSLAGEVAYDVIAVEQDGQASRQLRLLIPLPALSEAGRIVGVLEVEQDFEPLATHIHEMQLFAGVSLTGFALVLYLILFRLVSRAASELNRQAAISRALLGTAEELSRLVPLDQLLRDVAGQAVHLLSGDDAMIFLHAEGQEIFELRASVGVPPEKLAAFPARRVAIAQFRAFERICTTGSPLAIGDAPASVDLPPGLARWYGARSCLFVPLVLGDRVEGAMVVHFTRTSHQFSPDEIALGTGLAQQAALAIANARALELAAEIGTLREVNRLKSELVSIVSHELRNPLTSVIGYAELLTVRDYRPDQMKEMASVVVQEARRLNGIVEDLLNLGRFDSGRFSLDCQPADIVEVVREAAGRFQPTTNRHQVVVETATVPHVLLDRERFRQVIDNLITNAIRYSPNGGTIRLKVDTTAHEQVSVAVADEGLGLTREDIGRLFERFYRSARREIRAIKGTGLGLAVCQAIVEAHGGRITAESAGPNRGSVFTVLLPAQMAGDLPVHVDPPRGMVLAESGAPPSSAVPAVI